MNPVSILGASRTTVPFSFHFSMATALKVLTSNSFKTLNACYAGMAESIAGYILEQTVKVNNNKFMWRVDTAVKLFLQKFDLVLHTCGQTMLKCISKQILIKIYHVVQELRVF